MAEITDEDKQLAAQVRFICSCPSRPEYICAAHERIAQLSADRYAAGLAAQRTISVGYLQVGPGGICFAHGPYDGDQCPRMREWSETSTYAMTDCPCTTDPQKPEFVAMGMRSLAGKRPPKGEQP